MKQAQSLAELDERQDTATLGLLPQLVGDWEEPEPESALGRFRARCDELFDRVDPIEAALVRMLIARDRAGLAAARAFDEAGKGALYPVLAAAAVLVEGRGAFRIILACAIATALSQAVYPVLKQLVRRDRPIAFDPELGCGVAPVDRYSWPSGHSITATSFLVPFVVAGAPLVALIAPLVLLVLWSRVALGHHYPSDVLGGAALGTAIAAPTALLLGL